jgi:hypothetical protein
MEAHMAARKNGKADFKTAIDLLKADHRKVEELFAAYEKASGTSRKQKLAEQICMELSIHTMLEEEIFYPSLRGEADDDMLDQAQVEHDGAKTLIAELMAGNPDDDFFDAKVKVLSEEIKHHVKEEEQRDGIFAQAKASDVDLDAMLEQLKARKQELKEQLETSGIPTPETRSMRGAEVKIGQPLA